MHWSTSRFAKAWPPPPYGLYGHKLQRLCTQRTARRTSGKLGIDFVTKPKTTECLAFVKHPRRIGQKGCSRCSWPPTHVSHCEDPTKTATASAPTQGHGKPLTGTAFRPAAGTDPAPHRAACRQCWGHLAGDHGEGEVPGGYGANHLQGQKNSGQAGLVPQCVNCRHGTPGDEHGVAPAPRSLCSIMLMKSNTNKNTE